MTATTLLYSQFLQTITPTSLDLSPKKTNLSVRECCPKPLPNHMSSPLLALPLELRLQIYTYTLAIHKPPSPKIPTSNDTPLFPDHISTSLLLVNRQIYHEARLLPLSNTFVFAKCFGSSVYSARKFLTRLEDWQRVALRSVVISIVGREIVEDWRREEGWECIMAMLSHCNKVHVKVRLQEGDVWIGNRRGAAEDWRAKGGNVGPGFGMMWGVVMPVGGDVMPVGGDVKEGWVKKLLEGGERGEGVRLEFEWS